MSLINYLLIIGLAVLIIYNYPKLFVAVVIGLGVLFLIRLGADIFWWGRDKDKW